MAGALSLHLHDQHGVGNDSPRLEGVRDGLQRSRDEMLAMLERAIDRDAHYDAGCSLVRKLRFLETLEEEIDEALA